MIPNPRRREGWACFTLLIESPRLIMRYLAAHFGWPSPLKMRRDGGASMTLLPSLGTGENPALGLLAGVRPEHQGRFAASSAFRCRRTLVRVMAVISLES